MSERDPRDDATPDAVLLALEADGQLRADPQLLRDPARLGALHAHLREALGEEDAAATLLQAGFLQGLRDAQAAGNADPRQAAACPAAPRVPFSVGPRPGAGASQLAGTFSDAEAAGRRESLGPVPGWSCHVTAGYVSGWLSGLLGDDVLAVETACCADGAEACQFQARPVAAWRPEDGPAVRRALDRLDFSSLRLCMARDATSAPDEDDLDSLAVHVWGPVMIVPYGGVDECLSALDLIALDDSARDVSVVVLDLGGAILDSDLGAVVLEQVIEAIEQRGADTILTGVSPLSEPVVADLETRRLVVHKDLPEAVAAAFQIADAQRRVY